MSEGLHTSVSEAPNSAAANNAERLDFAETPAEAWERMAREVLEMEKTGDSPRENLGEKTKAEHLAKLDDPKFIAATYGGNFNYFVDNLYEGGPDDDRSDPENYVISMYLDKLGISEDQQFEMMRTRGRGENVATPELLDTFASYLKNSPLAEEIADDPFLRKRHKEFIAGRYQPSIAESADGSFEQETADLLWQLDMNFYNADTMIDLVSDDDYIALRYQDALDACAEKNPEHPKEAREYTIADISEALTDLITTQQVSGEELVKDPYLRAKHVDAIRAQSLKESENFSRLWDFDQKFYDSPEYIQAASDELNNGPRKEHPEIYDDVDAGQIEQITGELLGQIPDRKIQKIMKIYEKSPEKGDAALIKILLKPLGLDKNPPSLKYSKPRGDRAAGWYTRAEHSITLVREEDLEVLRAESDEPITPSFADFLSGNSGKKLDENMFFRMNAIAHETWHAHQWAGANVPADRQGAYHYNFQNYFQSKFSTTDYRNQLIEKEAYAFGESFEKRCKELYGYKEENE